MSLKRDGMLRPWTLFGSALALLLLSSCAWEEDLSRLKTPEWQGSLAAPVAKGSIRLGDALDQIGDFSYLRVDPDGTLVFLADFPLASYSLPELVSLPDFQVPFIEASMGVPFPIEGASRVDLSAGTLQYSIFQAVSQDVRVEFRLRDLLSNGQETRWVVLLEEAGVFEGSLDLAGSSFQPRNGLISLSYDVYLQNTQEPAAVDRVILGFSGLEIGYIEGSLETMELSLGQDSLPVKIDLDMELPQLTLLEPTMDIIIESQVGMPNRFSFASFSWIGSNGESLPLVYAPFNDGASLELPTGPKAWAETRFSLHRDNSNIVDLLASGIPSAIVSEPLIEAFPAGSGSGFLTDKDSVKVRVEAEAPLAFQLAEFELTQSFDLDLDIIDLIHSGSLVLVTENDIPLDMTLQALLLDEHGQQIDSLFDAQTPLLAGAAVNSQGTVTGPGQERLELVFDESTLQALDRASSIQFRARVSSSQGGQVPVRLNADQRLSFQLGALVR